MLAAGLLEEAERIGGDAVAASAVGYPQALAYLRGWSTERELRASLERATRRYARRQRAWFRSEPGTIWLAPEAVAAAVREKLEWSAKR
jgi:tRNA dimethylallyltransferase